MSAPVLPALDDRDASAVVSVEQIDGAPWVRIVVYRPVGTGEWLHDGAEAVACSVVGGDVRDAFRRCRAEVAARFRVQVPLSADPSSVAGAN